ncbi:WD and tetratricopeptide repeats protein 1-like isoform X2 [Culicoides brevitarsis]
MMRNYPDNSKINITHLLQERQQRDVQRIVKNRLQTTRPFLQRMELEAELKGHEGCVNCLEWSADGRVLASGSDDCHVILWDAFRHRKIKDLATPHRGNIFSVKFLPQTENSTLVTGAGDARIYGYDLNHHEPIFRCNCHQVRVKRLAVAAETPHLFWSACEDGRVFQFDLRESHKCQSNNEEIVLIDLTNHVGRYAEVKCIATNPRRPELLAIGANDPYARLYDRRMIKPDVMKVPLSFTAESEFYEDRIPRNGCVTYFAPGHLQKQRDIPQGAATYITFSPNGRELLVNIGAEQIYLYDILSKKQPELLDLPPLAACEAAKNTKTPAVSTVTEQMKQRGNELLDKELFTEAINQYSLAMEHSPNYPALYLNRATALMRRKWRGDLYAGLLDCTKALKLDPAYVKAQFRMARALLDMDFPKEAEKCLDEIRKRFPDFKNNHGVLMLNRDIETALEKKETNGNGMNGVEPTKLSDNEMHWRSSARDYKERFVGHCNIKTDIKEANFFGADGRYIVAGSDDGNLFIWERPSGIICEILTADKSILNCVQPHPYQCLLASSGIDHEIRLWSPQPIEGVEYQHKATETVDIKENQTRMATDSFEFDNFSGAVCRTS